jgi:hypothetical protein
MEQVSEATHGDREVVWRQIGRQPRGMVGVSKRCLHGCPQVVVTQPLLDSGQELFPTVYWLSCPHLVKLVSGLESERLIDYFRGRISSDPQFRERMERRHRQYALDRLSLVDEEQQQRVREDTPGLYRRLVEPGIGGIEHPDGIKCLHLHLADYLSSGDNPVGEEVCQLLLERGDSLECVAGACQAQPEAIAVVNVGSNSVKLLVASGQVDTCGGCRLHAMVKRVIITRLAERMISGSVEQSGLPERMLRPEAIERTAQAVDNLVRQAHLHNVSRVLVFGTAATRLAGNTDELAAEIRHRTGLELSVLSEHEEAELSFAGAASAMSSDAVRSHDSGTSGNVLVVDIGGASTEMAVGRNGAILGATSIAIGALTSLESVSSRSDSSGRLSVIGVSELLNQCSHAVASGLQRLPWETGSVVALGGSVTATAALLLGLDSYDSVAIHGFSVDRKNADDLLADLCQRTSIERREMRGMTSRERADSVIGGLAILVSLMDAASVGSVTVSEHGLLEGIACRELSSFRAARGGV